MNMMEPAGGKALTQILNHAGYLPTGLAFLVHDVLWLRLLALIANVSVAAAAFRTLPDPRMTIVAWTLAFALINLPHTIWLPYEHHLRSSSESAGRLAYRTRDRGARD